VASFTFIPVTVFTYLDAKYDIRTLPIGQLTTLTPDTYLEPIAKSLPSSAQALYNLIRSSGLWEKSASISKIYS